jgi:aspartyl-tRNA(Asn)/glutamyl-tRNA(Gln) amidotransferase subunit A
MQVEFSKRQTISKVAASLQQGDLNAVDLAKDYSQKAASANPKLNVFVSLTPELAEAQAKTASDKIGAQELASEIAGVPASIKDNFNWTDTKTTASSNILKDYVSPYNATVTDRLLTANAVFTGKTNMDAFAHGSSTETSDFGTTLNPYNTERVAGGSSGGAAAAVAAGLSVYAIGSETAGSVRGPAAWCGAYGFAPTFGRISRYGVVAMGSSLDRPGVIANSVYDCALVTDVIAGHDKYDATSIGEPSTDYAQKLTPHAGNLTLGLPKLFLDERIDADIRARVEEVVKAYEKLGAKIVEIDLLDPKYSMAVYTIICRSEVSSNLARIDGIRYGHQSEQKAADILTQISYNRGEGFGNEAKQRSMTGAYALSAGYYDAYYKKAQQVRTLIIDDFKRAFSEVDLIIGPTMPTVAPKLGVTKNNPLFGELADILTEPSALAGLPCISMPAGLNSEGLPIGVQLFGPQLAEQLVFDAAHLFETKISAELND